MAVGDLKGGVGKHEVIEVNAGAALTKGDVVHIEADNYWDFVQDGDTGKFGVTLDAATTEGDDIRVVIWGPVEVKACGAIGKGELVMAGNNATIGTVTAADFVKEGELVGTALEAAADGGLLTVFIGMVG